jgi:pyrroloquinoline quinone biosynthesis protein B
LAVSVFAVAGKQPVHLERRGTTLPSPEDNVGFEIVDTRTDKRCLYVSAASSLAGLESRLARADCLLFDGTFWTSTELIDLGLGTSRAEDMAHLPIGGPNGSLAQLARLPIARKIYTHINNTNPILRADAPERLEVERAGVEIATDGLEISL